MDSSLHYGGEKTYSVLVLHLLVTLDLLVCQRYEKQLGSRVYAWWWRTSALLCALCLAASVAMLPPDLSALVSEFYAVPRPLCVSDLDFTLRLLHLAWSLSLWLHFFTRPSRTRKLTLAASCRYVALKYAYSYEKLVAVCRKHRYAFFPICELEQYAANIEQGDSGGDIEGRAFHSGDIDHYLVELDRQEQALVGNEAQYAQQVEEARALYEKNRDPLVLARRRNAAMSYEQYMAMKRQLQQQGE
jgi:hypothetical protein